MEGQGESEGDYVGLDGKDKEKGWQSESYITYTNKTKNPDKYEVFEFTNDICCGLFAYIRIS